MERDHVFDEHTERLIARYVAGECSPEEAAELEAWMAADPRRLHYVDSVRRVWEATGALRSPWDSKAAWQAVRARLEERAPATAAPRLVAVPGARPRSWRVSGTSPLFRVAAVLALTISAAVWWYAERRAPSAAAPLREIATRRGQLAHVYLSDGTHVLLGVESRLRFAAPFGKKSRDVYLEGEALFDVKHDPRRPFRAHTARAVTEDLGTKFGVRAYPGDSTVTVVVVEGRVALRPSVEPAGAPPPTETLVLEPGDLGWVTAEGRLTAHHGVAVDRYLAWADGRLVFRNAPLREVLPELARWYDLDFRVSDPSLETRRLTAVFRDEPVSQMLRNLALTIDVRYTREGRTVTFFPKSRER